MLSDSDIAKGCLRNERSAQKELYDRYAKKMHTVCRRYISDKEEAKDVLQESFIKIFNNIDKYRGEGPLESWIRKVIVNTALSRLKKDKATLFVKAEEKEEEYYNAIEEVEEVSIFNADFKEQDLLGAIEALPENYRIVFNLHCLENYSHREIAAMLSISEEGSRTRLNRARKLLQEQLLSIYQEYLAKQST